MDGWKDHLAAASVSTTGLLGSSYRRRNSSGVSPALLSTVLRRTHSGLMAVVAQWWGWNSRSEKNPDTFFFSFDQGRREAAGGQRDGRDGRKDKVLSRNGSEAACSPVERGPLCTPTRGLPGLRPRVQN